MLYLIITIIIIYIAVPTYGIIRDLGQGEAVFVLNSPLSDVQMNRPEQGLIERIHGFLFPPKEVPVPILQRIDIKGRVIYSDKTPYANGIIELRSEPRYTRTDAEGYFIFMSVEVGEHTIGVIDEDGNVLAQCFIDIERTLQIKDAELIRLPDGTFVFQVAVDIKVLEITLFLEKGADGTITGVDGIEIGIAPDGTDVILPPVDPTEPPVDPTEPIDPIEPPVDPTNPPVKPTKPPVPPQPSPFDFDVYDTSTPTRYGTESAVNVNIFGDKKRIAPGMKGSYQFTVDNRGNDSPSRYDITFSAIDTLPAAKKIPMSFRLKADGAYVAGNGTTWCTLAQLYQDTVVPGKRDVKYTLEWHWPESARDNDFAAYANNAAFSYSLMIKVTAQMQ